MALNEWVPLDTDDYTVGKVTFTAGSTQIAFSEAFAGIQNAFYPGDEIYIPDAGKWLLLKSVDSNTKGTLLYPCPNDCTGTFPVRIRPLARNARQAGLAVTVLRNLQQGNLPSLTDIKAQKGQMLVAGDIAYDWSAEDIPKVDTTQFLDKKTYDPKNKKADAFGMGNMVESIEANNKIGALILTNAERSTIAANKKFIEEFKEHILDTMVTGAIEMYPFEEPGYRMMVANGSLYKRADFPVLWAAIKDRVDLVTEAEWNSGVQGAFSKGDGSTTFRVPNLLGPFPRFAGSDRKVGSRQGDMLKAHSHGYIKASGSNYLVPNGSYYGLPMAFGGTTDSTGGNETRPDNIALKPFIRF